MTTKRGFVFVGSIQTNAYHCRKECEVEYSCYNKHYYYKLDFLRLELLHIGCPSSNESPTFL